MLGAHPCPQPPAPGGLQGATGKLPKSPGASRCWVPSLNPWVLPARPAVGAQFRAEVTGMVLGWWRWPKSSCTPSAPSLKLHPWGCLAMNPLVMWGLETAFFWGRNKGGEGWCFLAEQAQSEGHRFALLQPPAPWTPGQGPPCCGVFLDMGFLVGCVLTAPWARLRGCGRAKQPGRTELGAQRGHPGLVVPLAPSVPSARELPRCLLLTGSCLPKGKKNDS